MNENESEKKQRPNANYKLSHENIPADEIVYHYNRERRLAKAPQSVRNLYLNKDETPRVFRRFNLLKPLTSSKPMAMMFASIVVVCVFILAASNFGLVGDTYTLDGNQLSVQAIRYDDTVIIALKKTVKKNILNRLVSPYTGAVGIAVSPTLAADTEQSLPPGNIFYHKIFFTLEPAEYYRFSVPFDSDSLSFVFQTEKKTLSLTVKPE